MFDAEFRGVAARSKIQNKTFRNISIIAISHVSNVPMNISSISCKFDSYLVIYEQPGSVDSM